MPVVNAQTIAEEAERIKARPIQAALDGALEPLDETIEELQQMVVQSRLLSADGASLGYAEMVSAICENLRRMCEHPDPNHAIAVAALALRIREEHL